MSVTRKSSITATRVKANGLAESQKDDAGGRRLPTGQADFEEEEEEEYAAKSRDRSPKAQQYQARGSIASELAAAAAAVERKGCMQAQSYVIIRVHARARAHARTQSAGCDAVKRLGRGVDRWAR